MPLPSPSSILSHLDSALIEGGSASFIPIINMINTVVFGIVSLVSTVIYSQDIEPEDPTLDHEEFDEDQVEGTLQDRMVSRNVRR